MDFGGAAMGGAGDAGFDFMSWYVLARNMMWGQKYVSLLFRLGECYCQLVHAI